MMHQASLLTTTTSFAKVDDLDDLPVYIGAVMVLEVCSRLHLWLSSLRGWVLLAYSAALWLSTSHFGPQIPLRRWVLKNSFTVKV